MVQEKFLKSKLWSGRRYGKVNFGLGEVRGKVDVCLEKVMEKKSFLWQVGFGPEEVLES